jgi:hypothetical protein
VRPGGPWLSCWLPTAPATSHRAAGVAPKTRALLLDRRWTPAAVMRSRPVDRALEETPASCMPCPLPACVG